MVQKKKSADGLIKDIKRQTRIVYSADVYFGRGASVLKKRKKIKMQTIRNRRKEYFKAKLLEVS